MSTLGWIIYSYKLSADSRRPYRVELEDDGYGQYLLYRSEDLAAEAMVGLSQRDAGARVYSIGRVEA